MGRVHDGTQGDISYMYIPHIFPEHLHRQAGLCLRHFYSASRVLPDSRVDNTVATLADLFSLVDTHSDDFHTSTGTAQQHFVDRGGRFVGRPQVPAIPGQ